MGESDLEGLGSCLDRYFFLFLDRYFIEKGINLSSGLINGLGTSRDVGALHHVNVVASSRCIGSL